MDGKKEFCIDCKSFIPINEAMGACVNPDKLWLGGKGLFARCLVNHNVACEFCEHKAVDDEC